MCQVFIIFLFFFLKFFFLFLLYVTDPVSKKIKDTKLKVQAKIQGNELRISGQKRDNLQEAISVIKEMKLDLPLQFVNMRD